MSTANQIVVRLLSQRELPSDTELSSHMPGSTLEQGDIRFTTRDEPADVIVVINYLRYDTPLTARRGYVWTWHNEPIVRMPFPKGYDRVYSHVHTADSRLRTAPPVLDWWLQKSFDELSELKPPRKSRLMSAIASTKQMIPGHDRRNAFINTLQKDFPEVEIFGRGRPMQLVNKWDGMGDYKFSIAIENTSTPDYWTEKIADCFLSYTVPLYFGATNIDHYFPRDSFIWLPIEEPERALDVIRDTLNAGLWEERLPALREARERVLHRYSLFGQVSAAVRSAREDILNAPLQRVRVHGRRTRRGGWIRGRGVLGNVSSQIEKYRVRHYREGR